MYWITTEAGELVNLAHACAIRVHSSDSSSGKYEVWAWFAYPATELDPGYFVLLRHPEKAVCLQFVTDLFVNMTRTQVLDRAPEPQKGT